MKKELVDYIGGLLFNMPQHAVAAHKLALQSEKQFSLQEDGNLGQEQSLNTTIIVDDTAISMCYVLPDGRMVNFVNAITDISCTLANDYTVSQIQYTVVPATASTASADTLLFILECDETGLRLVEANGDKKTLFIL